MATDQRGKRVRMTAAGNGLCWARTIAALLIGAGVLTGCSTSSSDEARLGGASIQGPSGLPPPQGQPDVAAPGADYRIGAGDLLDISVFQVPDLNKTVEVAGGGDISLPLIGS